MKVIEGFGVSRVLESDNTNFKPWDVVTGMTGWEEYSLIHNTDQLRKIQQDGIPLSYYVGLLGRFSFWFKSQSFFVYHNNIIVISSLQYLNVL